MYESKRESVHKPAFFKYGLTLLLALVLNPSAGFAQPPAETSPQPDQLAVPLPTHQAYTRLAIALARYRSIAKSDS